MIKFFDAGESHNKELVEIIKRLNVREPFIRVKKGSFYMELLQIFNVKLVNRVINIGSNIGNRNSDLSYDLIYSKPGVRSGKSVETIELFGNQALSIYKKSDVCIIAALGVVCKNALRLITTKAFLEKLSGDSVEDKIDSYNYYMSRTARR